MLGHVVSHELGSIWLYHVSIIHMSPGDLDCHVPPGTNPKEAVHLQILNDPGLSEIHPSHTTRSSEVHKVHQVVRCVQQWQQLDLLLFFGGRTFKKNLAPEGVRASLQTPASMCLEENSP